MRLELNEKSALKIELYFVSGNTRFIKLIFIKNWDD